MKEWFLDWYAVFMLLVLGFLLGMFVASGVEFTEASNSYERLEVGNEFHIRVNRVEYWCSPTGVE